MCGSVITECAEWEAQRNLLGITGEPEFQLFTCKGGEANELVLEAYQQKFIKEKIKTMWNWSNEGKTI